MTTSQDVIRWWMNVHVLVMKMMTMVRNSADTTVLVHTQTVTGE